MQLAAELLHEHFKHASATETARELAVWIDQAEKTEMQGLSSSEYHPIIKELFDLLQDQLSLLSPRNG